jgi:transcriptional regulator with XRE-family HTH domain
MDDDATFRRGFGRRLRQFRLDRALSQNDLAEAIDAQLSTINRYERGKTLPTSTVLVRLARVLNVPVGKLLLGVEDDQRAIAAAQIRDLELLDRFRAADKLSSADRQVIMRVVDAIVAESTA